MSQDDKTDERMFLRDIVSKPFDAVTAMEFMTLWGIANRVAAASAERATNAAPQAVSGDTEGGTGRTRGVIESDRRAGRPAALKSSDADLEPEDLPGRVERDRSIGPSPDSQPAVAAPASSALPQEPAGTLVPHVYLDGKRLPDEYGDWRAMPRQPTWQMKEAGGEAYLRSRELEGEKTGLTAMDMAEGVYMAMFKTKEVGTPPVAPNSAMKLADTLAAVATR